MFLNKKLSLSQVEDNVVDESVLREVVRATVFEKMCSLQDESFDIAKVGRKEDVG